MVEPHLLNRARIDTTLGYRSSITPGVSIEYDIRLSKQQTESEKAYEKLEAAFIYKRLPPSLPSFILMLTILYNPSPGRHCARAGVYRCQFVSSLSIIE